MRAHRSFVARVGYAALLAVAAYTARPAQAQDAEQLVSLNPKTVALAYKQHGTNCPSVAITKWAIASYGLDRSTGPFSVKVNPDKSESVTLANGEVVVVTPEQKKTAARHSSYDTQVMTDDPAAPDAALRQRVVDRANLLSAALAIALEGQRDGRTMDDAVFDSAFRDRLNKGGEVDYYFELFGFKLADLSQFPNTLPNVYGSSCHVVFAMHAAGSGAYNENLYDHFGELHPLSSYRFDHGTRWRYALKADPGSTSSNVVVRQCFRRRIGWGAC